VQVRVVKRRNAAMKKTDSIHIQKEKPNAGKERIIIYENKPLHESSISLCAAV